MAFGKPSVIKSERIRINEPDEDTNEVIVEESNVLEELKKQGRLVQEFNYKEDKPSQVADEIRIDKSNRVTNEIIIDRPNKTEETSTYYQQSIEPQSKEETSIYYQQSIESQSKKEETQRMVIEAQQRIVEERIERLEEQKKHIQNLEEKMKDLKCGHKNICVFEIFVGVPVLISILYVFNNFLKDNLSTIISSISFLYIGVIEILVITIFMIIISCATQKIYENNKETLDKEIQATEEKVQTLKKDIWIF